MIEFRCWCVLLDILVTLDALDSRELCSGGGSTPKLVRNCSIKVGDFGDFGVPPAGDLVPAGLLRTLALEPVGTGSLSSRALLVKPSWPTKFASVATFIRAVRSTQVSVRRALRTRGDLATCRARLCA